jgi:hypothetical protein
MLCVCLIISVHDVLSMCNVTQKFVRFRLIYSMLKFRTAKQCTVPNGGSSQGVYKLPADGNWARDISSL